jgi:hypothetical protein
VKATRLTIQDQISRGLKRHDESEIRKVFERYAEINPRDPKSRHLPKSKMLAAFQEFEITIKDTSKDNVVKLDELFDKLDSDKNGMLDLDEFQTAVQSNNSVLEEWAMSLPLHHLLADSIPWYEGEDAMKIVSNLSPEDVRLVVDGFAFGLEKILRKHVDLLKTTLQRISEQNDGHSPEQKFIADVPKMMCGNIDNFHNGLSARIGSYLA